ncbi:alpha/beta hydrolase [Actinotalea ferrariae]|nr:alpha/beta hydrolase [Actinotalea ferrariae]
MRPAGPATPDHLSPGARAFLATREPSLDYPAPDDVAAWQRLADRRDAEIRERAPQPGVPDGVEVRTVAGVATYVAEAGVPEDGSAPVNLHLHGGALVFGGGDLVGATAAEVAGETGLTAWCPDYRMPPSHPFPAGLDDALAVYRALLETRAPGRVVVSGLSAGGNLAAALLVRAREEGMPMPAALVLETPEVDLTESGDTFRTLDGVDNVLESLRPINELYAQGTDLAHPLVSPLFADLTGFPPTLLQSGTRDLFLSSTVRMHRRLLAAGVPAELHVFEAMPHAGFGGGTPEDAEVAATIRAFVRRHLAA